ncbi:glutamine-hydrolyzing GMP synthase [Gemmatimonadota bacterium]
MTAEIPTRPFIAILDFGGQYAHLIANRIRRLGMYSEIMPPDIESEVLENAVGIILSGGPSSVYDPGQPPYNAELFEHDIPILGLCYGHHLLAQQMGGQVARGDVREFGSAALRIISDKGPLKGLSDREEVWMSHGDQIVDLPEGFEILGSTDDCRVAAMGDASRRLYGFQFHPEVTHTPNGMRMLENFIDLCGAPLEWNVGDYIEEIGRDIVEQVGDNRVLLLVSGGVDSTVCFALLNQMIGSEKVKGVHIDNGLMRKNESRTVIAAFSEMGYDNLEYVDAIDRFLTPLEGVTDPEEKRRIIGRVFVEVAGDQLGGIDLQDGWLLAQGTIYPDTIETGGTQHAATIKTHHNRVEEIERLIEQGKIVEPLAHLYKDEVREAGLALGLPEALVWRHPFPGPGLGVRTLCATGEDLPEDEWRMMTEAEASATVIATEAGYEARVLPVRSVGVQGDYRTYAHPVMLTGGKREWGALEEISTRITNEVREVNRVVYSVSRSEPGQLHTRAATVTRDRLDLLREVDAIVMEVLAAADLERSAWQMITVLLPLAPTSGGECVVLRPVLSTEAMTAKFADLPWTAVDEMVHGIEAMTGISHVFYDVTHKPPATIEWE